MYDLKALSHNTSDEYIALEVFLTKLHNKSNKTGLQKELRHVIYFVWIVQQYYIKAQCCCPNRLNQISAIIFDGMANYLCFNQNNQGQNLAVKSIWVTKGREQGTLCMPHVFIFCLRGLFTRMNNKGLFGGCKSSLQTQKKIVT